MGISSTAAAVFGVYFKLQSFFFMPVFGLNNGLIPIVTLLGMSLPDLFAGAIITESVFGWPGIGKIALESVNIRDYTFLMGFNMLIVVLVLIGNLISDISYALVDPRVRLK